LHDGASFTDDCEIGPHCVLFRDAYLSQTTLGAYSYLQSGSVACNVAIGPYCSIGSSVTIGLAAHPTSMLSTSPVFYDPRQPLPAFLTDQVLFSASTPRTDIGADVWIGQGVMVKAGLRIGVGAVIGAGAVVTRDVEPYQIVGGNPARVIRARFPVEVVSQLVASRWWEAEPSVLRRLSASFGDPVSFLQALERTS
jgi:acetyltransferase-like isoleucine patch superfamily enzyme